MKNLSVLNTLFGKLGPLAKAIAAAVLPLVTVSLLNGSLDYKALVSAAVTAVVVFLVPNLKPKPAPVAKK